MRRDRHRIAGQHGSKPSPCSNANGRTVHTVTQREQVTLRLLRHVRRIGKSDVGFPGATASGSLLFGANTCAAGNAAGHGVSPGTRFVAELEFVMPVAASATMP